MEWLIPVVFFVVLDIGLHVKEGWDGNERGSETNIQERNKL